MKNKQMQPMSSNEAWGYAATWGSYISSGDPGACMYGFDEKFVMQNEEHRQNVIEQMAANRRNVLDNPEDFEDDELDNLDSFMLAVYQAPVSED